MLLKKVDHSFRYTCSTACQLTRSVFVSVAKKQKVADSSRKVLPDRTVRNTQPATLPGVKAAPRRTPAQVAAEREAKIKEAEVAFETYRKAQLALAQMNVEEENRLSPNLRLSTATGHKRKAAAVPESNSECESFEHVSSEDSSEDEAPKKADPKSKVSTSCSPLVVQAYYSTYMMIKNPPGTSQTEDEEWETKGLGASGGGRRAYRQSSWRWEWWEREKAGERWGLDQRVSYHMSHQHI